MAASSKSFMSIAFLPKRAAKIAASFNMFSKSAPENPTVRLAILSHSTFFSNGLFLAWIERIASLPFTSGNSKATRLSNLPGRTRAGSKTSGLLVAAITTNCSVGAKPSISTRIWFKVCSLSSWPPIKPYPLCLPMASTSSIKIIAGWAFLAVLNKSLTLDAPTPTNISINSEPAIEKNGTPASPAVALAKSVFPVPDGPIMSTPFGVLAPMALYFPGFFKKSTTSVNSCFASSTPATSLKETLGVSLL